MKKLLSLVTLLLSLSIALPAQAADIAFGTTQSAGYDNSGNWTWSNLDTTSCSVGVAVLRYYTAVRANLTDIKYNGVSHKTNSIGANLVSSHVPADSIEIFVFALGADAGNHAVNVTWTGGGYIGGSLQCYSGDVDAGLIETGGSAGNGAIRNNGSEIVSIPNFTDTYTTVADKAYPILVAVDSGNGDGWSSGTGATLRGHSSLGEALFDKGSTKTPAGSHTFNVGQSAVTFNNTIVFALKPSAPASPTITLSGTVAKYEGGTVLPYQRDADNSTDVILSGTYTSTAPTHVQVNWNSAGWVTLTSETISGGNWTGTFAAQAGNEGTLDIRESNATSTTTTTFFALGDYFLIIGDSIAGGQNVPNKASAAGPPKTREWTGNSGGVWFERDITTGPHWFPYIGDEIVASQSVPTGFINAAVSGTSTGHWVHGVGYFDDAMTVVTTSGLTRLRGVILVYGANNILSGSGNTPSSMGTAIATTVTDLGTYLPGGAVPVFEAVFGELDHTGGASLRTEMDNVKQGIFNKVADSTIKLGAVIVEDDYTDNVHPNSSTHATHYGQRFFTGISNALYSGSFGRGPAFSSANYVGTQAVIDVTYNQTLGNSVSSSVAGFRVTDSGTPATISSAVIQSSTSVRITLSAAISGTGLVSFGSENDAIGQTVPTSTTKTLPSGATMTLPEEPFWSQSISAAPPATTGSKLSLLGVGR